MSKSPFANAGGRFSPNFWFLSAIEASLHTCAVQAEQLALIDPHASMMKMRLFGELAAKFLAAHTGVFLEPDDTSVVVLRRLSTAQVLSDKAEVLFHTLRKAGNKASHSLSGTETDALSLLRLARLLAVWLHGVLSSDPVEYGDFTPPAPHEAAPQSLSPAENIISQAEKNNQRIRQTAAEQSTAALHGVIKRFKESGEKIALSEAETRVIIDSQLREAGWEIDSINLRYSKGTRPQKGRNLAIAEWSIGGKDSADYVLFVGLTPIAVVEAKKKNADVSAKLKQAERYSREYVVRGNELLPQASAWKSEFKIPFAFSTNGRPYLKQVSTKSGIWFRDLRQSVNLARPLESWYTPEGLRALLEQDIPTATQELASESLDYLDLRYYQVDAIKAIEAAIASHQRNILVAMATGTGKTRTCIGLVYRLCKAKRFRRVLFLVDRTALGEQTAEGLRDFRLEQNKTFTDIYDVKEMCDIRPEQETRLQIATIQGMIRRLLSPDENVLPISVDQYDCVIVDECHRGYSLDREMSETEMQFRDQRDYISQYTRVLDHFDAVRIGLTATPALHTSELFGVPVYTYAYRQAVIDGFLIDHEPPIRIVTALAEDGMSWAKGEEIDAIDSTTGEFETYKLEDELHIAIDDFNRKVITESFNEVVCTELVRHIDPTLQGKTLVFCATDGHADIVVDKLKQAFQQHYGSVDDRAVVKITAAADKPLDLLRHFKNERYPSVAVTVDLLTTGIDVPEIVNIVFIRRVRSRILYEQMLGRATRLCPAIDKEYFRIFDAVDIYAILKNHTDMNPVVVNPYISFSQLLHELEHTPTDEAYTLARDQFLAKFQRIKRHLKDEALESFEMLTDASPQDFITALRQGTQQVRHYLLAIRAKGSLGTFLDNLGRQNPKIFISSHEDSLRDVHRGYGDAQKPSDYLENFSVFLRDNKDRIPALLLVMQRPRELTRKQLRELRLLLDEHGFSEANLKTAWREATNQDIAASIIGFIRNAATGSPLLSHEERVQRAMRHILASRQWTVPQRQWLERIGRQLERESIVDKEALDRGAFERDGGFSRLNRIFDGQLETVLGDIAEAMWDDAA